jgi:hypothetical protein
VASYPPTRSAARSRGRPLSVSVLVASLLALSLVALAGGAALVAGPDGRYVAGVVDLDAAALAGTPLSDFAVPGVVLAVLGGYSLLPLAGLTIRAAWSWQSSAFAGLLTLSWVATGVAVGTPVGPVLPAVAGLAVATVAVTALPSVRAYCGA